ncbi:MAG: homoserine kinase [Woeseiaceae bacterium]|nr:homoserine kinase [Woeseiaceae bacterium]
MADNDFKTAFAPASIGNLGVGFDMLGLAIAGVGDRVSARKVDNAGIVIREVQDPDGNPHPFLSNDAAENTASIAAAALWEALGDGSGVELIVRKGIPLQSGMGSSAASAVAAVVAVNALLNMPLAAPDLLEYALVGEKFASGGLFADNVAPSLVGGLVLCPRVLLPDMIQLPAPDGVSSVLMHPELQVNTAESRKGLARNISVDKWLTQQGLLAGFVAACSQEDIDMLGRCLRDEIVEPQRANAVPCFADAKSAAHAAGALGCSLSGSGPSIFALCRDADASNVAAAMEQACHKMHYDCESWISPLATPGAHVE